MEYETQKTGSQTFEAPESAESVDPESLMNDSSALESADLYSQQAPARYDYLLLAEGAYHDLTVDDRTSIGWPHDLKNILEIKFSSSARSIVNTCSTIGLTFVFGPVQYSQQAPARYFMIIYYPLRALLEGNST